jgi:CRISPR/Cas system-associated endoribonuclease Cas2
MTIFYVAYDLDKPGQNYPNLWSELESLGAVRVQDSVWALKAEGTSEEVYNQLSPHIDSNDRLLVVKSGGSTWVRLMADPRKI